MGRAVTLSPRDQLGRQPEPRPDLERIALAGPIVNESERRREPLGVEFHGGVARLGMARGKALQRLEVRGGDTERPALGQGLQRRLGESRALVGIGAGAELVQQNERAVVHLLEDFLELLDEGGEGREVLGHALIVADDGEDGAQQGQPRALAGGHVQAGLRHETEKPEGLEGDGLAAGIGPRDHEERRGLADLDVHRNDRPLGRFPLLGEEQGIAGAESPRRVLVAHDGLRRLHPIGQLRPGEDAVESPQVFHEPLELGELLSHGVGQGGEHAEDLCLLLARHLHQVVVGLHDAFGLDEESGSALRPVVDDPLEAGLGLRSDGQDIAAVTDGDVALLEDVLGRRALEIGLESLDHLGAELAALLPEALERGARLVTHAAIGIERSAEKIGERAEGGQPGQGPSEIGSLGRDGAPIGAEPGRRLQEGRQAGQLSGLGDRSRDAGMLEETADIGDDIPGRRPGHGERLAGLAGLDESVANDLEVCLGLEGLGPLVPHRGAGVLGQEVPDPAPLRSPPGRD